MLAVPHYSRVGERPVDLNIKTLELKTPNNSPWEERHHGRSTLSFVLDNTKETKKNPFAEK